MLDHEPKHKQDEKSPEYVLAEAEDYQAFLERKSVPLRGTHHGRAASTVIKAHELGYRLRMARALKTVATTSVAVAA